MGGEWNTYIRMYMTEGLDGVGVNNHKHSVGAGVLCVGVVMS